MKTTIYITGSGIVSKNTLLRKIPTHREQVRKLMFNNYAIDFETKREAIKALSEAYQSMKSDLEYRGDVSYIRGYSLSYDAGRAEINKL